MPIRLFLNYFDIFGWIMKINYENLLSISLSFSGRLEIVKFRKKPEESIRTFKS